MSGEHKSKITNREEDCETNGVAVRKILIFRVRVKRSWCPHQQKGVFMSGISAWLLSITGVILLSVLCEFVLPEGQINRYTRVIFSFVTIFVIISPLPSLLNKEIDFSFPNYDYTLQEDYLYEINLNKLDAIQSDLQKEIEEAGIYNVKISISANAYSENLEIYSIYVELCDISFSSDFENKNKSEARRKIEEIISYMPALKDVPISYDDTKIL